MVQHDHPGLFIVLEGLGGSGATIAAKLLANALEKAGYRVHFTSEPTNNLIGGLIRAHMTKEWRATPDTLQLLFTADRSQHLTYDILPALQAGKIVICDRYAFSSIAYGSIEGDSQWLTELNSHFTLPDLTFLLEVRPKICAVRMKGTDHFDLELYRDEPRLTQIWEVYEKLSQDYPNWHRISGERGEVEIVKEMQDIVIERLNMR